MSFDTAGPERHSTSAAPLAAALSPRLRQVLDGLLAGESEKQVARRMTISKHTVHEYTKQIYRHFGVQSRGELLARFVESPDPTAPRTLQAPEPDAPELDHVHYCVQLLERNGFMVRYVDAACRLVGRRRGLVVTSAVTCIMAIGALLGSIDLAPAPAFDHGHDPSLHAIPMAPRHINASPTPGTRSCIARVELGDVLNWSTTPHDAEVEVCIDDRRLASRHDNVVQFPGHVYVYVAPSEQVIVHLHIDPSDDPPPEAEPLPEAELLP